MRDCDHACTKPAAQLGQPSSQPLEGQEVCFSIWAPDPWAPQRRSFRCWNRQPWSLRGVVQLAKSPSRASWLETKWPRISADQVGLSLLASAFPLLDRAKPPEVPPRGGMAKKRVGPPLAASFGDLWRPLSGSLFSSFFSLRSSLFSLLSSLFSLSSWSCEASIPPLDPFLSHPAGPEANKPCCSTVAVQLFII